MMNVTTLLFLVVVVSCFHLCVNAENLTYCTGKRITSLESLSSFQKCDVIEGNFIIGFKIANSKDEWRKYGGLRVREITGFVVFYFLDHLTSLDLIFPHLRVIRGNALYQNYALIIYGLMDLQTVSLNRLSVILNGSVFIRNNPWLTYYTHKVPWDRITYWNKGTDVTHINVIQHVQSPVVMCNESCQLNTTSVSHCWSANVCFKDCPESEHPFSCSSSGGPCPKECIGGCYKEANNTKCYACLHFRDGDGCTDSCFPKYQLNDFRCVSEHECKFKLGRKILKQQNSTLFKCVKECPPSFEPDIKDPSLCVPCSGCPKVCEGTHVVDSVEKAHHLSGCTTITGSLEVRIYGKRILQSLIDSLGKLQEVNGYVHIFQSRELKSLKFLESLVKINGNELFQNRSSLIVHDNDDLEELWNTTTSKLIIKKGQSMFYANPKLCSQSIERLIGKKAWKESVPDDNIRMVLNGNKRACNIDKNLDFTIEPLFEEGGLRIQIMTEKLPESYIINMVGFYIYYKEAKDENQNSFDDGRQWQSIFATYVNEEINLRLKTATKYAIYLESKTTESFHNFQSVIKYATTRPYNPSPPQDIEYKNGVDYIEVSWSPPRFPNGEVDHYIIVVKPVERENLGTINMCNSGEREKYFEYFKKEIENQKRVLKAEEDENKKNDSIPTKKKSCPVDGTTIDDSVDRTREHVNMAAKLSELIYISDPSIIRSKRDAGNGLLLEEICIKFDRQVRKSKPSGLSRKLNTSSHNNTFTPRLNLEEPLIKYLENKIDLSSFEKELASKYHSLSSGCIAYLVDLTTKLLLKNNTKIEAKRKNPPEESDGIMVYDTNFTITNLTSSAYDFRVMACHKKLNIVIECGDMYEVPCKLCSLWQKSRINHILEEEKYRGSITVLKTVGNNVTVTWTHPQYIQKSEILYYTIYVQEIGNSPSKSRNVHAHCASSSSNKSSFVVPKSGNYSVTVAAFSSINEELPRSKPDTFAIKDDYTPSASWNSTSDVIILILVLIFIGFLLGIYLYTRKREQKPSIDKINELIRIVENRSYGSIVFPPWKDYLEKTIDWMFLYYSPKNLSIEDYKVGQGHFGVVHTAYVEDSKGVSIKVAVKKLKSDTDNLSNSYKELIDEANLMLQIKSFHLVEMFGVAFTDKELYLVMEFMDNKSLSSYLIEKKIDDDIFKLFTKEQIVQIAVQIADGMAYLSHKEIVHRDLATRNCLLDKYLNAKVSDFGMSRKVEGGFYKIKDYKAVPIRWMPPEFFNENIFTSQSDVWSYGVLLWEIMNPGKIPYENIKRSENVELEVINNCWPGTISERAPFAAIMASCWNISSHDRPTFMKIVHDLLALKSANENFKNFFTYNSFYFCGEYSQEKETIDTAEADEQDVTPHTPLTTPSLSKTRISRNGKFNCHRLTEDSESLRDRNSFRRWHWRQFSSLQRSLSKSFPIINTLKATFSSSQNKVDEPSVKNKEAINTVDKDKVRETVLCISPSRKVLNSNHICVDLSSADKRGDENHVQIPNGNHISFNEFLCNR